MVSVTTQWSGPPYFSSRARYIFVRSVDVTRRFRINAARTVTGSNARSSRRDVTRTVVVWAILVGFLVWGEIPDTPMLIGTTVIIASGVYTLYRERKTANLAAEALAGEGM